VLEGKKPALCCIIVGNVIFVHFREMAIYIFDKLNAKGNLARDRGFCEIKQKPPLIL
jgi:hypothetical protein